MSPELKMHKKLPAIMSLNIESMNSWCCYVSECNRCCEHFGSISHTFNTMLMRREAKLFTAVLSYIIWTVCRKTKPNTTNYQFGIPLISLKVSRSYWSDSRSYWSDSRMYELILPICINIDLEAANDLLLNVKARFVNVFVQFLNGTVPDFKMFIRQNYINWFSICLLRKHGRHRNSCLCFFCLHCCQEFVLLFTGADLIGT